MRILIALVFLTGCDDSPGLQGLPYDTNHADGLTGCPDVDGLQPEDWVDPGELADAEVAGVRGCFIDQRLVTLVGNRCERDAEYTVFDAETIIRGCLTQSDDFQANGRAECFAVWSSGTCNEIADSKDGPAGAAGGCAGILPILRREGRLACP